MYKLGDKVETPLGIGIYKGHIDGGIYEGAHKVYLNANTNEIYFWDIKELKPYQTPHEKLIEMGYEEKIHDTVVKSNVESGRYKQYAKSSKVILIDVEGGEFTTYTLYNRDKGVSDVSWVNHKLSHILTQYLDELNETPST